MPAYEYRCKQCGRTHEIEHGFHDERPAVCPSCGGQLVRVFHPVGVVFKGSGFHKTDYTASGLRKEAKPAAPGADQTAGAKAADKPSDGKPSTDAASTSSGGSTPSTKSDASGPKKPSKPSDP